MEIFGIKTGANQFFYLTEEEIERRGIEKEFWMHRDEEGNWVFGWQDLTNLVE